MPEDLRDELEQGRRLDRALARDLASRVAPGAPVRRRASAGTPGPDADAVLVRAAKHGDLAARASLVEAHMPLIGALAATYRTGRVSRVELLQEGVVGLLRALHGFDPDRGVPFWGYAAWWVRQAMQQLVSELTRPVVLSDRALRHLARLKDAHREAVATAGREPSRLELADRSGLTLDQVDDLLATERSPRSLDEPIGTREGDLGTFGELLADPLAEDAYEEVLVALELAELHALLSGLSERERAVLRARYGLDGEEQSLREVGARLGLSAERVRQIERRALGKLAAGAGVDTDADAA